MLPARSLQYQTLPERRRIENCRRELRDPPRLGNCDHCLVFGLNGHWGPAGRAASADRLAAVRMVPAIMLMRQKFERQLIEKRYSHSVPLAVRRVFGMQNVDVFGTCSYNPYLLVIQNHSGFGLQLRCSLHSSTGV